MRDLWRRYLAEPRNDAPSTATRRLFWSGLFCDYCEERGLALAELTRAELEAYLQWLLWTPLANGRLRSPSTVYQGMAMLRQFLRWAASEGHLADPTRGWLLGKPTSKQPGVLSRAQLETLLNAPPPTPTGLRNRAVLHTIAELGFYGERCSSLDLADLDLVGYQLRGLRLSAQLAELFHRYFRHARPALLANPAETALFLSKNGARMSPAAVVMMLVSYTRAHRVSPRTLRRSWLAHRDAFLNRRLPEA